ncbi:MAG: HAD family hydrolase [Gemmatimonadota bacterium]
MSTLHRAVFLDRDGTLIEDPGYLRDPALVQLLPGAADAVRRLNAATVLAIVVTNQSGIARGLMTVQDYRATEQRLDELLANEGAHLDAHYFCPHLPEITGPCLCRKPGTLLYQQAAGRFPIDVTRSWWIGDQLRDVLPAGSMGGRGVLLTGRDDENVSQHEFATAPDLAAAVSLVLSP